MKSLRILLSSSLLGIYTITQIFSFGIVLFFTHTETYAAYTESSRYSFAYFQDRLRGKGQDIEGEYRLNGRANIDTLNYTKNLVNDAYNRLPDTPDVASINETARKGTILALDEAIRNPLSQTYVNNAVSAIARFISESKINQIKGDVSLNPVSGNAPLTVSFSAVGVVDPSGVTPDAGNYIWWIRTNGGYRQEIGYGTSFRYTFMREGTYQVFLDVISGSRNSKGYTDVLPLSIGKTIDVKPRLGEMILLLNGVNVSNLSTFKVSPTVGKMGLIFDATASRAVSNGSIRRTKWEFNNGSNTVVYDGPPVIERQIFANQGTYNVSLELETNEGSKFTKTLQLVVVDPAAVISSDRDTGFVGEEFQMRAQNYFSNVSNVEYRWTIQSTDSIDGKVLASQVGQAFSYKFLQQGNYLVTLITKSPNGSEDRDTKLIMIDSHDPTVNLDEPRPISTEKPNTLVFDASRSFDTDTKNAKDLLFKWSIDGNAVALDNVEKDGAKGTYTFSEKGAHTVSLTVTNKYEKFTKVDKQFTVNSTLAVNMNIVPRVATIRTPITFQGISRNAEFYEWDMGDGSPLVSGNESSITHSYNKTGIFTVTLTVKNGDGSESNSIQRKVYITDAGNPYALIDIHNASNSSIEDPDACGQGGAFLVNRSEGINIDGGNSVNIDGNTQGITYTWKYLDRVKTGPTLSEKFSELGCFPITLTVKSTKNGASHSTTRYIQIKNLEPKLTAISTKIDQNKKDTQKVIVNVSADGARDEDGVITSYIWYYTTESDSEPQNIKITQSPTTTFVLPNVNEKYTFGVIMEDNDGARINSRESLSQQTPLTITNENGNVNMPLITLSVGKSQVLAGESVNFTAKAKTILGTDITSKSEYNWDFDGDGRVDKKSTEPTTSYIYKNSGTYTAKVKVTYNGISNSKYQNIVVKNELKARVIGYKNPDSIYLINTSEGIYDRVSWQLGNVQSDNLYSLTLPGDIFSASGVDTRILTVADGANESASVEIDPSSLVDISTQTGILYQTYPIESSGAIHVTYRGQKVLISLFGNLGTQYAIDTNTQIDSDTNGTPDDDVDNKDYPSYIDGSAFAFDTTEMRTRNQTLKLSIMKNGITTGSKEVTIIADFIADASTQNTDLSNGSGTIFSERDKANLEKLQEQIRKMESDERIILTQEYNTLIENWDDTLERTKKLIDIQEEINNSSTLGTSDKSELSSLIDTILIGDATAVDEVSVASKVIESLIPSNNPNRQSILEKLESIKAHPGNLTENKTLGSSILEMIKDDTTIEDKYKLLIKSQLQVIINGGQASIPASETGSLVSEAEGGSGLLGFIGGTVKVFGIIIVIILIIVFIGFMFYRTSRKNEDMGFQDFLIDSIFHAKNTPPPEKKAEAETKSDPLGNIPLEPSPTKTEPIVDPMSQFGSHIGTPPSSPVENIASSPLRSETIPSSVEGENPNTHASIPDWLKPATDEQVVSPVIEEKEETLTPVVDTEVTEASEEQIDETSAKEDTEVTENISVQDDNVPDWLKGVDVSGEEHVTPIVDNEPISTSDIPSDTSDVANISPVPEEELVSNTDAATESTPTAPEAEGLPDWLVNSVNNTEESPKKEEKKKSPRTKKTKEAPTEKTETPPQASTPTNTSDLPDWLK